MNRPFGYRNELRAFNEKKLAEDANKADCIVAVVGLALFALYLIARHFGVVA